MSDPTRWREDPTGPPLGVDVLLRGARRPRAPRPDEQARMDAAINLISRQTSFSSRGWSPLAMAAAAAVTIAGLGTGAWAWRASVRNAERAPIAAADHTNVRMPKARAAEPAPPDLELLEPPPAHKAAPRHDARAVRAPRRERPAPVVAAAGPVAPTDTLVWETALVDAARRDLASAPARALGSLETHRREFRRGQLAAEREFLAVEALRRLGRMSEARQRATELQAHYPNSSYATRAARLLDAAPGRPAATP